ncbi:MAG TPA: class I SAM-dependent methyltransferase [Thermoleophilaceae bacterium]|nr:class I SAM-dependent methyltransferase [Thermoleophilaceae bacterium]
MDLDQMKAGAKMLWSQGEYRRIAELLEPAASALVDGCAISAGQEVLDVAAGDGNVALAAAREGAAVVATDLSPLMVENGRARTEAEGYDIEWSEADAESLPFEDDRFECAVSCFGAVFAPRPEVVAQELFRVVRPGNTVGFTSWTPASWPGRMFDLMGRYLPRPEGVPSPNDWGVEEIARERLSPHAATVEIEQRSLRWEFDSVDDMLDLFDRAAPPQVLAQQALGERYADARAEMREFVPDERPLVVEPEYLLVVARRRG